ncbi:peptidase inhibitor family I36 protein [Saccharopolyspora erythraea]|uniref:peptidase inhibitor family I36 protein n=1 Tax=Saccharopolyspora erythraea TaxID=1836 RepID=UPI002011BA47|nr:peptidase inhibitor family I36 protein [Saccharopolyspora erythraea]
MALASATAAHATSTAGPATIEPHACPADSFCAWPSSDFQGAAHQTEVSAVPLGRCVALPQDFEATSFANNTGRPVTVYQDGFCSTEADFRTYPTGSFVPRSPYVARAIQVWSH